MGENSYPYVSAQISQFCKGKASRGRKWQASFFTGSRGPAYVEILVKASRTGGLVTLTTHDSGGGEDDGWP